MTTSAQQQVEQGLREAVTFTSHPAKPYALADRMARYGVTGCAISVIDNGRVAWMAGYGTTRIGGQLVDQNTQFQAASISKVVNALAVLKLVDTGRIDLDRDVNEQLRSWQLPRHDQWAASPVTVAMLLAHVAGTSTPGFVGYAPGVEIPTTTDILNGTPPANSEPVVVVTEPAAEFHYSGGGTTILQLLIEDVTGHCYPEAIAELVLRPLEMTNSHYDHPIDRETHPNSAWGHFVSGGELKGGGNIKPTFAAGGLWSSVSDLSLLVLHLQQLGRGEAGLLSQGLATRMLSPLAPSPHGLGPELVGDDHAHRFRHNGTNRGFCCQLEGLLTKGSGCVVMTNGDGGNSLLGEILRSVANAYHWQGYNASPIETVIVAEDHLRLFVGNYSGREGTSMTLAVEDGELFVPSPYGRRVIIPLATDRFVDAETGAEVHLLRHQDLSVEAVVFVDGHEILRFQKDN